MHVTGTHSLLDENQHMCRGWHALLHKKPVCASVQVLVPQVQMARTCNIKLLGPPCKGPYVATLWTIFTFARRSLMTGWACVPFQEPRC